jgi:hypothetical protein
MSNARTHGVVPRTRRGALTALLVGVALAMSTSGVVLAAAPSNDTFSGATAVTGDFSEVLDTTEATTDADDAQLNSSCGAPATDASVWYAVTSSSGATVSVDVSQSDYSAGVLVGVGTQGNLTTVACGPGGTQFAADAGTTYYVLAIDDQGDETGNGGSLNIAFTFGPPPISVTLTVDNAGRVNTKTGEVTISGTVACSSAAEFTDINVVVRQALGRFTIHGSGFAGTDCGPTPTDWTVSLTGDNGKFAPGRATVNVDAFACDPISCDDEQLMLSVRLRK